MHEMRGATHHERLTTRPLTTTPVQVQSQVVAALAGIGL
jgi:hypothetical protein